jgi:hypothetical protein
MTNGDDPQLKEIDRRRERRLKQFAQYREEDRHEWSLLVTRVTSLVTSQTFLVAAVGIFYRSYPPSGVEHLVWIGWLALVVDMVVDLAIVIGCSVLRAWHRQGMALIKQDGGDCGKADHPDNFLGGLYLRRQNQPDWRHIISVDVPLTGVPILLGIGWGVYIWIHSECASKYALAIIGAVWLVLLVVFEVLGGRGLEQKIFD